MKSTIITVILFCSVLVLSFSQERNDDAVSKAREYFKEEIQNTIKILKSFRETAETKTVDVKAFKAFYVSSRQSFKKLEFLSEYLDRFLSKGINGPNIKKADHRNVNLPTVEPQGFQVLEELIYADFDDSKRDLIIAQLHHLIKGFEELYKGIDEYRIYDRILFEALQDEVLRISFMGLSGFDSPVSKQSISEATEALKSCRHVLGFYEKGLAAVVKDSLFSTLDKAILLLESTKDFEDFDRLNFYRNYTSRLYHLIYLAQINLGIETAGESSMFSRAKNESAQHVFSDKFLNPYYYSRYKDEKADSVLRRLGKFLFFDPILSKDVQRSCASCHNPDIGFADSLTKSLAFGGNGFIGRNSPGLINVAFQDAYFYDSRAKSLEDQVDHVVFNHAEFNLSGTEIIARIKSSKGYVELFKTAYKLKNDDFSYYEIKHAIAHYLRSLSSMNSEFDKYMRFEANSLSDQAKEGFNLFMGKAQCGTCHFAPLFNGTVPPFYKETETEVLGVPENKRKKGARIDPDKGRFIVENSAVYEYAFKTPGIRNIALTAPYMHNGVFTSLEELIEFYDDGGGLGLGIEVPNQTLPADKLGLSKKEKKALVAFLKCLTDTSLKEEAPHTLPAVEADEILTSRKVGGNY